MNEPSQSTDSLQREVDRLREEVMALADANVRAAELMVELDEARAFTEALERRSEELTLQHAVDNLIVEQRESRLLCHGLVEILLATRGLGIRESIGVYLASAGALELCTARGPSPVEIDGMSVAQLADYSAPAGWLLVPLLASRGVVGLLVFHVRDTPAWRERWDGLLNSLARALGGALERLALDAELRETTHALECARDDALAASKAKSQFLATMSHELRTPLNAIIGYAQLVVEEAPDFELNKDLHKIERAGHHLLALITDILDLSKIEAGKMTLLVSGFSLRQVVDDVATTTAPLAKVNANVFVWHVDDDVPDQMVGDVTKLRQILLNLLSNAAKFTDAGKISLAVSRVADMVEFRVRDTGIGMSPEVIERIFDSFIQADASTRRRYGGTGLGLAIARRQCELMGGSVEVESVVGEGTTFVVCIPAVIEAPPEDPQYPEF